MNFWCFDVSFFKEASDWGAHLFVPGINISSFLSFSSDGLLRQFSLLELELVVSVCVNGLIRVSCALSIILSGGSAFLSGRPSSRSPPRLSGGQSGPGLELLAAA